MKAKTKLVIRRLPPQLPEAVFFKSIERWKDSIVWSLYVPGKISTTLSKETRLSRAYVAIDDTTSLFDFYRFVNGHVFEDSKGNLYQSIVEFATCQTYGITGKVRLDQRMNTIDADADYIKFSDDMKNKITMSAIADKNDVKLLSKNLSGNQKITPLIEALRAEREDKKKKKGESIESRGLSLKKPVALLIPTVIEESQDIKKKKKRSSRKGKVIANPDLKHLSKLPAQPSVFTPAITLMGPHVKSTANLTPFKLTLLKKS